MKLALLNLLRRHRWFLSRSTKKRSAAAKLGWAKRRERLKFVAVIPRDPLYATFIPAAPISSSPISESRNNRNHPPTLP
jgi:hypothetical protein